MPRWFEFAASGRRCWGRMNGDWTRRRRGGRRQAALEVAFVEVAELLAAHGGHAGPKDDEAVRRQLHELLGQPPRAPLLGVRRGPPAAGEEHRGPAPRLRSGRIVAEP